MKTRRSRDVTDDECQCLHVSQQAVLLRRGVHLQDPQDRGSAHPSAGEVNLSVSSPAADLTLSASAPPRPDTSSLVWKLILLLLERLQVYSLI